MWFAITDCVTPVCFLIGKYAGLQFESDKRLLRNTRWRRRRVSAFHFSPPSLMPPEQPAESGAIRRAEEDRLNHLGREEDYFLVGKDDNEVQNPLAVFFPSCE